MNRDTTPDPRDLLREIIEDNPGKSVAEHRRLFREAVWDDLGSDPDFMDAIIKDVFEDLLRGLRHKA